MPQRRILIIDDEPDIREVAKIALESLGGWAVLTAGSGPEGIEIAAAERPDAILLDVMMPDMDGPATLRELQSNEATKSIPVIMLTAKVQGTDQQRFAGLGVADVLAKPFDPVQLPDQVAAALERS